MPFSTCFLSLFNSYMRVSLRSEKKSNASYNGFRMRAQYEKANYPICNVCFLELGREFGFGLLITLVIFPLARPESQEKMLFWF